MILRPENLTEAIESKAAAPDACAIAGGTDVMVSLNFDRARPSTMLDLGHVAELRDWAVDDGRLRIGAGVTYRRVIDELGVAAPGLAMASRTVGSPQIRNRGTVGGNVATASPAGDALPLLYACDAEVELVSLDGVRVLPIHEFISGPKRTALAGKELIASVRLPFADGPQQFCKVGTRNAMVISVCSVGLAVQVERRRVSACVGSAGPTPLRAGEAEAFAAGVLAEADLWESRGAIADSALDRFGELVASAARPIDDVRGTADYRRHAVKVLARRALAWAWDDYRRGIGCA